MDRSRNFGFLLKDVSRRYVQLFEHRARGVSLTLSQCKVLVRLERNQGVSQARLAELAEIEPMTMVRILDRMESDGWLERRPDPSDRRARCLYLTKRSKPLLDEIWRLADLTLADAFAGVGNSEREAFLKLLERVHRNVCVVDDAPGGAGGEDAPLHLEPEAKPRVRKASSRARL
jgi:MarR family transcriptional regulator, transcriptional regulator for hemolysin